MARVLATSAMNVKNIRLKSRTMDRFDKQFVENTIALTEWRARRGGTWPSRSSSDEEESKLATWIGNQRLLATGIRAGRWTEERSAFLDSRVPGWFEQSVSPRLETEFAIKVDELCHWVSTYERWPQGSARDDTERKLWNRLNNFRRAEKGSLAGRWNAQRRLLLDTRLPGWRGRAQITDVELDVAQISLGEK